MQKTYSQKVARVFEVIGYLMLLPAAIGALAGFLAIANQPLYALLIYVILGIGVTLLVGYFKYSRGRLEEKFCSALWLTTAVYNFLLLLPWLYGTSALLQSGFKDYDGSTDGGLVIFFLFLISIVFSYLAAIVASLKAYSFEKRKKLL